MLKRAIRLARSGPLRALGRAAVRAIPDVPCTLNYSGLGRFSVRLRRHRWMFWEDPLRDDAFSVALFARMTRPGDVFFDVGANIGVYARLVLHWFGANEVVAFEPMSQNLTMLRENIRLGGDEDRVRVFGLALADHDGFEALQIDDVAGGSAVLDSISGGRASMSRQLAGLPPASERVELVKLDTIMEREGLPVPDLIKIDTEGAEVVVLEGARQTLAAHRPRLIIALHGEDKAVGTVRVLDSLGYAAYGIVREADGSTRHRRLDEEFARRLGNNNIIASMREDEVSAPIELLKSRPVLNHNLARTAAARSAEE